MGDLVWTSVVDLARMIATKEVSPVEVTRAFPRARRRARRTLKSFITVTGDSARDAARRRRRPTSWPEGAGPAPRVPSAQGSCSTRRVCGRPAARRSWLIRADGRRHRRAPPPRGRRDRPRQAQHARVRLRAGRAERATTATREIPGTHSQTRVTGGSSSDRAPPSRRRSFRSRSAPTTGAPSAIPAALCGITGIKPTYGREPRGRLAARVVDGPLGPMARSAADCAIVLRAMAGYDPADPTTSVLPRADYGGPALTGEIKGLRVGLLRPFFMWMARRRVTAASRAPRAHSKLGAVVAGSSAGERCGRWRPHPFANRRQRGRSPNSRAWMRTRSADYQPADVRERLKMGRSSPGPVRPGPAGARPCPGRGGRGARSPRRAAWRDDAVPAPVLGQTETRIGTRRRTCAPALIRLTRPFNFSGHPASRCRGGVSGDGLPIGCSSWVARSTRRPCCASPRLSARNGLQSAATAAA